MIAPKPLTFQSFGRTVRAAITGLRQRRASGDTSPLRVVGTIRQRDRTYNVMENGEYRRVKA